MRRIRPAGLSFARGLPYHSLVAEKKGRKSPTKGVRRRRKPAGASTGLTATELQAAAPPGEVAELHRAIEGDGGKALAIYREPYGGKWVCLAALPIERVEPTPYQRNLSDTHVRKLEGVIGKLGRFLDPIIAVRAPQGVDAGPSVTPTRPRQEAGAPQEGGKGVEGVKGHVKYWTPNGNHRLSAMKTLGAKTITAIVIPESGAAYQILALNTEKAHNLREKSLEVIRMYRELVGLDHVSEEHYALEFEEPSFITLGLCYEERPRFSGGAYNPVLKRVEQFLTKPLKAALAIRQERAKTVLALDDLVVKRVEALKANGLSSPYLKSFVVARINPIRFRPKDAPPLSFDGALDRMTKAAEKFNPDKIKDSDLATTGGAPDEGE